MADKFISHSTEYMYSMNIFFIVIPIATYIVFFSVCVSKITPFFLNGSTDLYQTCLSSTNLLLCC